MRNLEEVKAVLRKALKEAAGQMEKRKARLKELNSANLEPDVALQIRTLDIAAASGLAASVLTAAVLEIDADFISRLLACGCDVSADQSREQYARILLCELLVYTQDCDIQSVPEGQARTLYFLEILLASLERRTELLVQTFSPQSSGHDRKTVPQERQRALRL